ncbi:hypothetical protein ACIF6L_34915 [Kitasatospora sp. NPDC086009]|uniref:hypothetical protein n=1 Tax=unclassified Kitasatospora TaxID=2633591 RepID=UPI0037C5B141
MNVNLLQHISRCDNAVTDFITRAREAAGSEPAPLPADRAGAYREAMQRATDLGLDWQTYLDAMAWQAAAESALHMGETFVVRSQTCPECRTVGLVWVRALGKVACINRHCAARSADGTHRSWTMAQLAVARQGRQQPLKAAR